MPTKPKKQNISIIGSGAAAILLAAHIDIEKYKVTLYEQKTAPARKFLVAGDGGLNLTHSEAMPEFISRFTPQSFLAEALTQFTNTDLTDWLQSIEIETYTGSSKRIFPKEGIKPIEVLNTILGTIKAKKITIKNNHIFIGWNESGELLFKHKEAEVCIKPDIAVMALGGGSWAKTGSDGAWSSILKEKGINVLPFFPSNCAYNVAWTDELSKLIEGQPLKNIQITTNDTTKTGEIMLTKTGIEGGAVYALSPEIRAQFMEKGNAEIFIDLKPTTDIHVLQYELSHHGQKNTTEYLKNKLKLSAVAINLLKNLLTKAEYTHTDTLAEKIKALPINITSMATLDEAISTVGGIDLEEVTPNFELKKLTNTYAIGEMLDWDAPTGGYLLQGSFSMGVHLARYLNGKNL